MPPNKEERRDAVSSPNVWAVIPTSILYDRSLPAAAKLLYASISSLTHKEGFCYATTSYFVDLFQNSEATIFRLMAQLEKSGYIERIVERNEQTGEVISRKIYLTIAGAAVNPPPLKNERTPPIKNERTPPIKNERTPPLKNDRENNINNNILPPIVPQSGGRKSARKAEKEEQVSTQLFDLFWSRYPARKGRKSGKADARKVWNRLSITEEHFTAIMTGLEAYIQSDDVKRGFAMDASRWLRGKRWEDEAHVDETMAPVPAVSNSELLPDEDMEDYEW